jgi:hypothetical protein
MQYAFNIETVVQEGNPSCCRCQKPITEVFAYRLFDSEKGAFVGYIHISCKVGKDIQDPDELCSH